MEMESHYTPAGFRDRSLRAILIDEVDEFPAPAGRLAEEYARRDAEVIQWIRDGLDESINPRPFPFRPKSWAQRLRMWFGRLSGRRRV